MIASKETIKAMLASASSAMMNALAREIQDIHSLFVKSGGFGSSRMRIAMGEATKDLFRLAADTMATKARAYSGGAIDGLDRLVDDALNTLIERVLTDYFKDGWDQSLKSELIRLKDAAVRDLVYLPSDHPIGTHITITHNTAPVNVAAASGSKAQRSVVTQSDAGLIAWLLEVRSKAMQAQISEVDRSEIIDQVEVIEAEVAKPAPDSSRIARWGKRLVDGAEKIGISVASSVITNLLKSHGIG
jgi:hypothetical protein